MLIKIQNVNFNQLSAFRFSVFYFHVSIFGFSKFIFSEIHIIKFQKKIERSSINNNFFERKTFQDSVFRFSLAKFFKFNNLTQHFSSFCFFRFLYSTTIFKFRFQTKSLQIQKWTFPRNVISFQIRFSSFV